ncbi:MAG TPA: hypothetical protein VF160_14220 [Candidatus Dormibacteraeota bacterium]
MSPRIFNWRPAVGALLRSMSTAKPIPRVPYRDLLRQSRPLDLRRPQPRLHLN